MSLENIYDATEFYVSEFIHNYDLAILVKEFKKHIGLRNVAVFRYLSWLPFGENSTDEEIKNLKIWNTDIPVYRVTRPQSRYRYNIGVMSISHGYESGMSVEDVKNEGLIYHYLAYILDNKKKEIWLFDSLSKNPKKEKITGFSSFAKVMYPQYAIQSMKICSGCGQYEPENDKELIKQNIFCHTWTMYFIYMTLKGIKEKSEIVDVVEYLNLSCSSPVQNLIKVKQFAYHIVTHYTNIELPPEFMTIFIPKDRSGLGIYQHIQALEASPQFL